MTIGEIIRQTRISEGLTRRSLSVLSGISETGIEYIEYGKRQPRLDTLYKISDALDRVLVIRHERDKTTFTLEVKKSARSREFEDVVCSDEMRKRMMNSAVKICGFDRVKAQDLVQETIYQALIHSDRYNAKSQLFTWLYAMMKNINSNEQKKLKSLTFVEQYFEIGTEPDELKEKQRVRDYLTGLSPKTKELVKLRLLNTPYNEIAERLGKNTDYLRFAHYKTIKLIRDKLKAV